MDHLKMFCRVTGQIVQMHCMIPVEELSDMMNDSLTEMNVTSFSMKPQSMSETGTSDVIDVESNLKKVHLDSDDEEQFNNIYQLLQVKHEKKKKEREQKERLLEIKKIEERERINRNRFNFRQEYLYNLYQKRKMDNDGFFESNEA